MAKLAGAAALLVTASVIGGTLIGSALAAPSASSSDRSTAAHGGPLGGEAGEYCDVYLDTLASELGVRRDDLLPASKSAAEAAIDAAVAAGDLDEERAATLKDRIAGIDEAGCGLVGGIGKAFGRGFGHGFVRADVLDAAADALGIESAELMDLLADGASLQEVADEKGVAYDTVKSDVLAALDADLDTAVNNGLAQERADAIHDRVAEWLDAGGERPAHPFGGRFGRGERPFEMQ
jgi:hypothetical protein